jgi:hypothetical protein
VQHNPGRRIVKPSIGVRLALASVSEPHFQRVLLLALLAGLLVAGLFPFNFFPANQVSWLLRTHGVHFSGYGEVRAFWTAPEDLTNSTEAGSGTTVELWITCERALPEVSDLLAVYHSHDREPFAIEQSITDLILIGVVRDPQGWSEFRHMSLDNVLRAGTQHFVTITTSKQGTTIYLEGVPRKAYPSVKLTRDNFDGTLLLGQTPHGHQEWRGDVRGLAVYWKVLTPDEVAANYDAWKRGDWQELRRRAPAAAIYPFDEGSGTLVHNRGNLGGDLAIPLRLRALDPVILAVPSHHDLTNVSDVTLNIVGFVPFGGLVVVHLKNRRWSNAKAVMAAVAAGLMVSLTIELLQVLLPSRDSSLLDVINNTLGSGIGAGLGVTAWPWLQRMVRSISVHS